MIYQYWGKTDLEGDYHLLVYHCLDVSAVAAAYMEAHPEFIELIANELGTSLWEARQLILFFITIHDLGKFSICFQSKNETVCKQLLPNRSLRENTIYRHDQLGAALWDDFWKNSGKQLKIDKFITRDDDVELRQALNILIGASAGHHGKPVCGYNEHEQMLEAFDNNDVDAAYFFINQCIDFYLSDLVVDLTHYEDEEKVEEAAASMSWWLSGLTILADWLGSNTAYFPYQAAHMSFEQYWNNAIHNARRAISDVGLDSFAIAQNLSFNDLFKIKNRRPLQAYAEQVSLGSSAQLFILEDITGSGKTEAAFMLAYRLMSQGLAEGMYFGLPTMATANGMYRRAHNYYNNFYDKSQNQSPSLMLAHGKSGFVDAFQQSIKYPKTESALSDEHDTATNYCNVWFTDNRKKALLANIGVGTVDQALQAILPNRHQSLRLVGLFKKVLIIDEVHAYDPYMLCLLSKLIRFHTAGGGSTILLSATLPISARRQLIRAFDSNMEITDQSYPLATHCSYKQQAVCTPIATQPDLKRTVKLELTTEYSHVKSGILDKLNQGYCVCWIRNTVQDAIDAYQQLFDCYDSDKITLFHSRFTLHDRLNIEEKVVKLFGQDSDVSQRQGQLVIATQVIEQSLDLDFDHMISDLAPIELLIQRMGRLQRHAKLFNRPAPVLQVFGEYPLYTDNKTWLNSTIPRSKYIYNDLSQLWLTACWVVDKGELQVPDQVREAVEYSHDKTQTVPDCIREISDQAEGEARSKKESARLFGLSYQKGYTLAPSSYEWWEDTVSPTRLAELKTSQVMLGTLDNDSGQVKPWHPDVEHPWHKSAVTIPAYYLPDEETATTIKDSQLANRLPEAIRYLKQAELLIFPDNSGIASWYLVKVFGDPQWYEYQVDNLGYQATIGLMKNPHKGGK